MTEPKTAIGANIRRIRIEKGLSQDDLARALNTSKAAISRYELNQREPKYSRLQAIANGLGVDITNLTNGQAPPEPQTLPKRAKTKKKNPPTARQRRANKLLSLFDQLSDDAQSKAIDRIREMTEIPRYRRES